MNAESISPLIAKFSFKFVKELEKDKSGVSSPLSAELVLGLLALGTGEPSHSELLAALGVAHDDHLRSTFSSISSHLKTVKRVTLNIANKVYVKDGEYEVHPELKRDAVNVFDADFEKINFAEGAAAADTINKWVESKTNNRIKDLLTPDSLDDSTRLVLVNALYFKGAWINKFETHSTQPRPFHVDGTTTVNVPTMYQQDKFMYGESQELNTQFLRMDYEGNSSSLLIVLPREVEGLDPMLSKLADGYDIITDLNKMHSTKVKVSLPKFKIETEIDLNRLLPKIGIGSIFKPCNTGINKLLSSGEELTVNKAVQKAFIEVNEEGAEAAAATAMGIMLCSAMVDFDPVQEFVADRPFLAVILIGNTPFFLATYRGKN